MKKRRAREENVVKVTYGFVVMKSAKGEEFSERRNEDYVQAKA